MSPSPSNLHPPLSKMTLTTTSTGIVQYPLFTISPFWLSFPSLPPYLHPFLLTLSYPINPSTKTQYTHIYHDCISYLTPNPPGSTLYNHPCKFPSSSLCGCNAENWTQPKLTSCRNKPFQIHFL